MTDDPPLIDRINPWPHQARGCDAVLDAFVRGVRRVLLTSPTGGGKSLTAAMIARAFLLEERGVVLFTNRKMLLDQMVKGFRHYGFDVGVRAADHDTSPGAMLQVSSIQTELSRVSKRRRWQPHRAQCLIFDEAHLHDTPQAHAVRKAYREAYPDVFEVGITATPIGLSACYDELVVAGTTSELRACGALVPATMHGCDEPDMRNIRRIVVGEDISENDQRKLIMVPGIHGRVIDWFRRLNPHGLPSIGFAPGVPESLGFAEAFQAAGIDAAHIDGDKLWIRGEEFNSTQEKRDELLEMSRAGAVRIVWNRFVLREAIDMPWLCHGVLATVFGSLQSYIQSGGRILRAYPTIRSVTVQDHGGNWWRHGSLNADREWRLTDTANSVAHMTLDGLFGEGAPKEKEPFCCSQCRQVMTLPRGATRVTCRNCGFVMDFKMRSRPVIQADGELIEHEGAPVQPRRTERRPDTEALWRSIYWRAAKSKSQMTFNAAAGLFCHEHGYFPPRDLPMMPRSAWQWYMPVSKVPFQDLVPKGE